MTPPDLGVTLARMPASVDDVPDDSISREELASLGGQARRDAMTPEERSASSSKAASARFTHEGVARSFVKKYRTGTLAQRRAMLAVLRQEGLID